MNLTVSEVASLPMPAALLSGADVLAATPEWQGAGPGTTTYTARNARLVVGAPRSTPAAVPLVERLLTELDAAVGELPAPRCLRVAMLAESLRLVAGGHRGVRGSSEDVVEYALAGIGARTELAVATTSGTPFEVFAPAVAALVLVQLAANAERHDDASAARLATGEGIFSLTWAAGGDTTVATAARRRSQRRRWGLGFARIAADAIGAAVFTPAANGDGTVTATMEVGLQRLALPLAVVRDGRILKATRAWDEETAVSPGAPITPGRVADLVGAAASVPGRTVAIDGWTARCTGGDTWLAIPPDEPVDRARDVLDGLAHEEVLWSAVGPARRVAVVALAAIAGWTLGVPVQRVPAQAWNAAAPAIAAALGLPAPLPRLEGVGALDPRVAFYLASELGGRIEADGDQLVIRVPPERRRSPLAVLFAASETGVVRVS